MNRSQTNEMMSGKDKQVTSTAKAQTVGAVNFKPRSPMRSAASESVRPNDADRGQINFFSSFFRIRSISKAWEPKHGFHVYLTTAKARTLRLFTFTEEHHGSITY